MVGNVYSRAVEDILKMGVRIDLAQDGFIIGTKEDINSRIIKLKLPAYGKCHVALGLRGLVILHKATARYVGAEIMVVIS